MEADASRADRRMGRHPDRSYAPRRRQRERSDIFGKMAWCDAAVYSYGMSEQKRHVHGNQRQISPTMCRQQGELLTKPGHFQSKVIPDLLKEYFCQAGPDPNMGQGYLYQMTKYLSFAGLAECALGKHCRQAELTKVYNNKVERNKIETHTASVSKHNMLIATAPTLLALLVRESSSQEITAHAYHDHEILEHT